MAKTSAKPKETPTLHLPSQLQTVQVFRPKKFGDHYHGC
jgi:hypothetical protein